MRPAGWMILVLGLVWSQAVMAANLLVNPGFEEGANGWVGFGCTVSTSTVHRGGSYSGWASHRTASWQGLRQSMLGRMEPGKTYTVCAWMRLQGVAQDSIAATMQQVDDRGTRYSRVAASTGYADCWTSIEGRFTLEVVGTLKGLDLYFEGPDPGVDYYLDDVEVLPPGPPLEPNACAWVDVNTPYQEIEGFGASGAWYENWLTAHPLKDQIYDVLFGQLGLDIYRVRNTYQTSQTYLDRTAQILQAAGVSLGHPIKVMVSSWSPPASLKSNGKTQGGTLASTQQGGYRYGEFAKWWVDSLVELARLGVHADYVSIQNEPDYLADWDSCVFAPSETAEAAGYDLALEAVLAEMTVRMPTPPRLLAPETAGFGASGDYLDALIDPNHVYGYAHHLYGDGRYDEPESFVRAMQNYAARYGGKPLFQTEYSRLSDEEPFEVALDLACHIHNSLVHEGVCSFCYWDLFWGGEGGLVTLDNPWQSRPGYTINPTYYAFKQYSAFTDPGWRRVKAQTDSSGLQISAFESPSHDRLTVVVINVSDIGISLSLSLGSFPAVSSEVYRTSATENTVGIGPFDASGPLMLPSKSITTLSLTGACASGDGTGASVTP